MCPNDIQNQWHWNFNLYGFKVLFGNAISKCYMYVYNATYVVSAYDKTKLLDIGPLSNEPAIHMYWFINIDWNHKPGEWQACYE